MAELDINFDYLVQNQNNQVCLYVQILKTKYLC